MSSSELLSFASIKVISFASTVSDIILSSVTSEDCFISADSVDCGCSGVLSDAFLVVSFSSEISSFETDQGSIASDALPLEAVFSSSSPEIDFSSDSLNFMSCFESKACESFSSSDFTDTLSSIALRSDALLNVFFNFVSELSFVLSLVWFASISSEISSCCSFLEDSPSSPPMVSFVSNVV